MSTGKADPRAGERYRRVRLAVALGGFERIAGAISGALRVALLVRSLNPGDYGLYVAVFGIVSTANLLDFGLHYGLLNEVSHASGSDDRERMRRALSTGSVVYSLVAIFALGVLLPAIRWGPIDWLFGLSPNQVPAARWVAVFGFGALLTTMPTKIATAGVVGLQRAYVASAYRTTSTLIQLAVLFTVVYFWPGRLVPVVLASSALDVALAFSFLAWVSRRYSELRITFSSATRSLVRPLFATGLGFLFTNLANLFRRSLASVVVAHSLGTAAVPAFSVPLALFTIALGFSETISSSLWPAYGEAAARGDWAWVERAYRLGTRAALAAGFCFATLGVSAGEEVVRLWSSRVVAAPVGLLAWLALWLLSQVSTHCAATLLGGLGKNRTVMFAVSVEGVVTLGVASVLVRHAGATGVIATMAVAGTAGAIFLQSIAVPTHTEQKVRAPWSSWVRLSLTAVAATGLALVVKTRFMPAMGPIPRLVGAGSLAGGLYGSGLVFFVLTGTERASAGAWLRRRLGR